MAATHKCQVLVAASEAGDQELMRELKRTLGNTHSGQTVPTCLEGKVTPVTVLEKFKECYELLYNSAGTQQTMAIIKQRVQELINHSSTIEIQKVTGKVVKAACMRMKPGKTDVTEAYTSGSVKWTRVSI